MSLQTIDFDNTNGSRYYTVSKLGPNRSLTPEGYLLCLGVPVARTGQMLYAEGELLGEDGATILGGPDKLIRVERGADELMRAETIASFEGKPVTLAHPSGEFVGPGNFAKHARGTMVNVRAGTGLETDLLLADLLITDAEAIKAVQEDGIEEVSLGYEADYQQQEPGRAAQRNIVGNHLALVERGRCGPRCAIGDESMTKKKTSFKDLLMRAFKAKDSDEVEKLAREAETGDDAPDDDEDDDKGSKKTNDALTQVLKRLTAIDERLEKIEAEDDDDDDDKNKTADTVLEAEEADKLDETGVKLYTGDAGSRIRELAEIIAPGTKVPTFDAKTTDAQRAHALCRCQRKALDAAYKTEDGRAVIGPLLGGNAPEFDTLPAPMINATFHGAAQIMRARNNDSARPFSAATRDFGRTSTVATINSRNAEFWANRNSH